jgi:hypothetical protein
VTGRKKNTPRRQQAATSGPNLSDRDDQAKRLEIEKQWVQAQIDREQQARDAVRKDDRPGGAAEALRFLAERATQKEIRSSGGTKAVRKALGTMMSFEEWRARWTRAYETDIVRLIRLAADAPRSLKDIKSLPGPSRQMIEPTRVVQMAAKLKTAVALIRELDADDYWRKVTQLQLKEALDLYVDNLSTAAQRLLRLDRSPTFKSVGHENDEWVLENIRRLTGRSYREKTTVIMRAVYPLADHWPVEAESLRRWQRRRRPR